MWHKRNNSALRVQVLEKTLSTEYCTHLHRTTSVLEAVKLWHPRPPCSSAVTDHGHNFTSDRSIKASQTRCEDVSGSHCPSLLQENRPADVSGGLVQCKEPRERRGPKLGVWLRPALQGTSWCPSRPVWAITSTRLHPCTCVSRPLPAAGTVSGSEHALSVIHNRRPCPP